MKLLKFQGFLCGIPGRNRTANDALGEHCYIHLTTETYQVLQGLRGEMDRLESALLKHTIKSTVHTSESEYRGSRVYPKSVISLINRGSLIHLTTETYQVLQGHRGEMDRLESALLKHTIKSTVHTSESEYRGFRVYPKSVISLINRGSLIHLTTETYQSAQGRDVSYVNILPQKRQKE